MSHDSSRVVFERRSFLKSAMATLAAVGFGRQAMATQQDSSTGIPTRLLGRTGERTARMHARSP